MHFYFIHGGVELEHSTWRTHTIVTIMTIDDGDMLMMCVYCAVSVASQYIYIRNVLFIMSHGCTIFIYSYAWAHGTATEYVGRLVFGTCTSAAIRRIGMMLTMNDEYMLEYKKLK